MRTTVDLQPAALQAARQLASHRAQSLGTVISELILRGLRSESPIQSKGGFPLLGGNASKPITLDDVKSAEEEA